MSPFSLAGTLTLEEAANALGLAPELVAEIAADGGLGGAILIADGWHFPAATIAGIQQRGVLRGSPVTPASAAGQRR